MNEPRLLEDVPADILLHHLQASFRRMQLMCPEHPMMAPAEQMVKLAEQYYTVETQAKQRDILAQFKAARKQFQQLQTN